MRSYAGNPLTWPLKSPILKSFQNVTICGGGVPWTRIIHFENTVRSVKCLALWLPNCHDIVAVFIYKEHVYQCDTPLKARALTHRSPHSDLDLHLKWKTLFISMSSGCVWLIVFIILICGEHIQAHWIDHKLCLCHGVISGVNQVLSYIEVFLLWLWNIYFDFKNIFFKSKQIFQ